MWVEYIVISFWLLMNIFRETIGIALCIPSNVVDSACHRRVRLKMIEINFVELETAIIALKD